MYGRPKKGERGPPVTKKKKGGERRFFPRGKKGSKTTTYS